MATETIRIQIRRGTAAQWTSANPIMGQAEFGVETDTGKFKIGDGVTPWNSITNYFEPGATEDYVTGDELDTELSGYLTSASAASTYLTQSVAAADYLTKLAAQSTYAALSGATFIGNVTTEGNMTVEGNAAFDGTVTLSQDPSSNLQAATKQYVDNVAAGIQAKAAVLAASTTNLSGTYDNGTAGVGATLNLGQLAALDIDGITTWEQYDGILLKDQTDATQNGRWVVDQIGNDTDTDWILKRCSECDTADEIPGAYMFVLSGTVNAGTGWTLVVADATTFTVGTDDITAYEFTASTSYSAGAGINLAGNEFSIDSTVATLTGTQTLTNKTIQGAAINNSTFISPVEKFQSLSASNNIVSVSPDVANTPSVGLYYSSVDVDYSFLFTSLTVPSDETYVYTLIVSNPVSGAVPQLVNVFRGGAILNVLWADGAKPLETNGIDVYTFTFIGTNTYCIGSMTSYS